MKKILRLLCLLTTLCVAFAVSGCNGGEPEPSYENGYKIVFEATYKSMANGKEINAKYTIDGKSDFDNLYIAEGETLGDRLPDLTKISLDDIITLGCFDLPKDLEEGNVKFDWYFLLNGKEVIIDKNTIFSEANIEVPKCNVIKLKIKPYGTFAGVE